MRMDKIIIDQTGIKQQVINEICELAQKYNVEQVLYLVHVQGEITKEQVISIWQ